MRDAAGAGGGFDSARGGLCDGFFTVSGGGGTWGVDAADVQYAYYLIGRVLVISLRLLSTSITGTVTGLTIKPPPGLSLRSNTDFSVLTMSLPGPLGVVGEVNSNATNGYLSISRLSGAAFPVGTNNTNLKGTLVVGLAGTLRDAIRDRVGDAAGGTLPA